MTRHQIETICWKEFVWRRSFKLEQVHEMLAHLATVSSRGAVIWEIRARDGFVRHLLGADSASIHKITEALQVHGEIEFYPVDEHNRKAVDTVRQIKVSHPSLSLRTDITESTIRAGLAAMAATARGEEAVLQIILGAAYPPSTIPKNLPDPNAGWLQAVLGNVSQASTETRKSIKEKAEQHTFQAIVRIGVSGASAKYRINCVLSALRTLEAAGVRIYDEFDKPAKLNTVQVPWHFPLRLSVRELAGFLMLPSGDEELPGMSGVYSRAMYPPTWYREPTNRFNDHSFGTTLNSANSQKLSISPDDSLRPTIILGPTGAGKTTITNLINRFYDIADGKIRYDGINVNKIAKPDLRHSLGIVLQETNLFTGTVMENIRYGKLDATDEECIRAAKLANADGFITRLPDGYDTMLTANGGNLSQGQRQLIAIARAAVADPPVMILDEATSSIDTHTEALVQAGMDALMKGRTVFVIAHRLSTVRNSDCIMVLDHGRIIERGTHDDLIAQKGTYYQLYTGAFELE